MTEINSNLIVRYLGRQSYIPVWHAMQKFTDERTECSLDEIWFVEHDPVFTQGLAGKAEHILNNSDIPIVQVDRGGQVTYHGPGQLVVYVLIDLKRKKLGVRQLVTIIENSVIELLNQYQINASAKSDAPGVYVSNQKICSLGLKIRKGCSFHGLALNVTMDKTPFNQINPCGYAGMQICQIADFVNTVELNQVSKNILPIIMKQLNYQHFQTANFELAEQESLGEK